MVTSVRYTRVKAHRLTLYTQKKKKKNLKTFQAFPAVIITLIWYVSNIICNNMLVFKAYEIKLQGATTVGRWSAILELQYKDIILYIPRQVCKRWAYICTSLNSKGSLKCCYVWRNIDSKWPFIIIALVWQYANCFTLMQVLDLRRLMKTEEMFGPMEML